MNELTTLWMANNLDYEGFQKTVKDMKRKRKKVDTSNPAEVKDEWVRLQKAMAGIQ